MEIKSAVAALGALAQETRLAVFRLLIEAGPGGLPAGLIAARLEVAPATLSFHLGQLERAGPGCSRPAGTAGRFSMPPTSKARGGLWLS